MHIKYLLRAEDLAAFARFHYKASRTLRRSVLRQQILEALAFVISVAGWIRHPEDPVYLFFAVGSILALAWTTYGEPRRYVRNAIKMRGEGKGGNDPVSVEITLQDDGLSIIDSNVQAHLLWKGLEKIEFSQGCCFAYVSGASALIIPRATVSEGDYDAFVAELTSRFEKSLIQFQETK